MALSLDSPHNLWSQTAKKNSQKNIKIVARIRPLIFKEVDNCVTFPEQKGAKVIFIGCFL
jgi:hypothetical protein